MTDLESDRVERTTSINNTDKFSEVVCAFANDFPSHRLPGYLLIGVNDDGTLNGLKVTDQLLQNLAGLRSDGNIQPIPAIIVQKYSLDGAEVAVVEVLPSDLPPVRYKGRICIRVGPRRGYATEQEEKILSEKRLSFAHSFDARPCFDSSIADLALGQFEAYRTQAIAEDVIQENHRSLEEQLTSLRFFSPQSAVPTYAGILLFGKNPRFFLPGAYIQYLRMPGAERTDLPLDQAEIFGDLRSVLQEIDIRIRASVQNSLHSISVLQEKLVSDYPQISIREILMNAVMHRNYESNTPIQFYWFSDRIEIHSPGGLYGEATVENFPAQNSYRNPVLAEAMKNLGYVNRFGYGVSRAQKLLSENGNPPADFRFTQHSVLAIIRRRLD